MLVKAARKDTNDPRPRHPADIYGIIARDESCAVPARVLLLGNYFPPRQKAQLLPHYVGRFPSWLSFLRARACASQREIRSERRLEALARTDSRECDDCAR